MLFLFYNILKIVISGSVADFVCYAVSQKRGWKKWPDYIYGMRPRWERLTRFFFSFLVVVVCKSVIYILSLCTKVKQKGFYPYFPRYERKLYHYLKRVFILFVCVCCRFFLLIMYYRAHTHACMVCLTICKSVIYIYWIFFTFITNCKSMCYKYFYG